MSTASLALPRTRHEALAELAALEALGARRRVKDGPARLRASVPPKFAPWAAPARYKGAKGGRGSAKSQSAARMLLLRHIGEPGTRSVCIREVQHTMEESVKQLLKDLIDEFELPGFEVRESKIITPGDGVISFKGMQNYTAANIKSLQGYRIAWVEEADALSADSLEQLRPTMREEDSELWFTWNPKSPLDPVDKLFNSDTMPVEWVLVESNHNDNPHFPAVLRAELERDYAMDPELASHVWGGSYKRRSKATVFKNFRVEAFDTPSDAAFLFGGDFGFSVDPTTLVRCFIPRPRVLMIDAEAYQVGCEIDDTPALFDKIDASRPCMARTWQIIADSARPETISYLKRHGYPRIESARKGPNSVEEGIKFLQNYEIIAHPRCIYTIKEFIDYSHKVHPLTGEVLPMLADKKNHVIDAVRYAVEKVRKGAQWVNW